MADPKSSEQEFIELVEQHGIAKAASIIGMTPRNANYRRRNLERKYNRQIVRGGGFQFDPSEIPGRIHADLDDGMIVIGSDAHYWPGIVSTAHRAFVKFCREFRPKIVVMNGDVFDGASVSRHPPIGWEDRPKLIDEIEACKDRLGEITVAADKARRYWPLGNHDARFETRLATVASEYAKVHGVHLHDHFGDWDNCWSLWVNDDIVIKHRNKGGIHATHNNTVNAGKTIVTGHLHSLKATPFTDYNGTRWGVDTGTMAEPFGPQFTDYMEDNPRNWRSGFAVLTIERGELRQPETVAVVREGVVDFRGKTHSV